MLAFFFLSNENPLHLKVSWLLRNTTPSFVPLKWSEKLYTYRKKLLSCLHIFSLGKKKYRYLITVLLMLSCSKSFKSNRLHVWFCYMHSSELNILFLPANKMQASFLSAAMRLYQIKFHLPNFVEPAFIV